MGFYYEWSDSAMIFMSEDNSSVSQNSNNFISISFDL